MRVWLFLDCLCLLVRLGRGVVFLWEGEPAMGQAAGRRDWRCEAPACRRCASLSLGGEVGRLQREVSVSSQPVRASPECGGKEPNYLDASRSAQGCPANHGARAQGEGGHRPRGPAARRGTRRGKHLVAIFGAILRFTRESSE